MNDGVKEEYKRKIIALIHALVPEVEIYLFGSRARGTEKPTSDIDLALKGEKQIDFYVLGEIKEVLLATDIPYKIDIVDVNNVSEELRAVIAREGILWT